MKKILTLLLLTVIVFNSIAGNRKDDEDIKVKLTYNLPLRVLDIKVNLERTVFTKGIFAQYAEKYLGVSAQEIITEDSETWSLISVSLNSHQETDPQGIFNLKMTNKYDALKLSLTPEGYLMAFNAETIQKAENQTGTFINQQRAKTKNIILGRFALDKPYKIVEDTSIIIVAENGEAIERSKIKGKRVSKTLEQKAADAAHLIFKLRKRRFKILTCNYDKLPQDGQSYKEIISHLETLEQRYLDLFFGKEEHITQTRSFAVTPKKGKQSYVVTRYSKTEGFAKASNITAQPIILEINDILVEAESTTAQVVGEAEIQRNYLHYRQAARANIVIIYGKQEIGRKNMTIPQLGHIAKISTDVLISEKMSILFYPTLGSLQRIYSNK